MSSSNSTIDWGDSFNSYDDLNSYNDSMLPGISGGDGNSNLIANSVDGIFGLPYQFSNIVDPSAEGMPNMGRKYSEKIFTNMPILFLTPGEPVFMEGFSKEAKEEAARGALAGESISNIGNDADNGKYYSFRSDFPEYELYADIALQSLANLMGIAEVPIPGGTTTPIGQIHVSSFLNNAFTRFFDMDTTVPFFLDAETTIGESFSNSTQESMISQTVNGFSQTAREIQFIMGSKDFGGFLGSADSAVKEVSQNLLSAMGDLGEVVAGKNLLSRVTRELTTIVAGGKILFPEIWSGSEYDRSYDINIKLRSPDPDPVSIFLNVYMPIILLVSMAAPRQIGNSSNSYESPFLVRATYKSVFSCDLGMITQLSINKGGDGKWNLMGHPTYADVTLTIKDLYNSMFISKNFGGLIANTAQMDYLSMMAGIDLNAFEPERMMNLTQMIFTNHGGNWMHNKFSQIKSSLNNKTNRLLSTIGFDTRYNG